MNTYTRSQPDIFDQFIFGYESTKATLRQISDILQRTDIYLEQGAIIPRGLLLTGAPGTGKSTLCNCLATSSGRKALIFRKSSEDNEFLNELTKVFDEAISKSPSILILEDIHLFGSNPYDSSWASIQAAMDSCKAQDVFVVATANSTEYITPSLLRPGRFDYILNIDPPRGKIAAAIINHYLEGFALGEDIIIDDLVKILDGHSCATLETAVNIAKTNAIYDGSDFIHKKHLIPALMQVLFQAKKPENAFSEVEQQHIAIHEASHAVVSEVLRSGSTSVVSIYSSGINASGITANIRNADFTDEDILCSAIIGLAGKAGVDVICGRFDVGAGDDLQKVYQLLSSWATRYAGNGFGSLESCDRSTSEQSTREHELLIAAKMEELYQKAKNIIFENRELVCALTEALLKEQALFSSEIVNIMNH